MSRWSTSRRTALVFAGAIALGSRFVATCTLALALPMPHQIDTGCARSSRLKPASRALQRGDGDAGSLVSEAVTTRVEGSSLHVEICDDGVGGAQPEGSGLPGGS